MIRSSLLLRTLTTVVAVGISASVALAGDLRNVKHGDPVPTIKLPAIDGSIVDTSTLRGSVIVIVCLAAEQRRSELAAAESAQVIREFASDKVKLLHVTADAIQKPYFEALRQQQNIEAPLLFDPDRSLYAKLGLIVFPTTVIVEPKGNLDSAISLHGSDYKTLLDANIRHALGELSDDQLKERIAAQPSSEASPKSAASAHRSLARLMREKGMPDSARAELGKALDLDPGNIEAQLDLADLNIASGDYPAADAALARVIADQPQHLRAREMQGECWFRQGKLDEARNALEATLELSPNPERAHYFLGMILERQGQEKEALQHYREALRIALHDVPIPSTEPKK